MRVFVHTCVQMDGSAFAAFMGLNPALDYSLPYEPLELDSSSSLLGGCGSSERGVERLCDT